MCNLLPGPSSTQLAIYCASRVAGWPGALVGGAGFILPGLVIVLALSALFLGSAPPEGCGPRVRAAELRWRRLRPARRSTCSARRGRG